MDTAKIVAILFIVVGGIALVFGGFSYPEKHEASMGPLHMSVTEHHDVSMPVWLGIGALVLGGLMLAMKKA